VYSVDDGGDPSRAAALAQDLISTKKVAALTATFAPLSMAGIVPVVERNKTPMIGGDAIDPAWFSNPLLFPQGAGLDAMVEGSLRLAVSQGKTSRRACARRSRRRSPSAPRRSGPRWCTRHRSR
jgi:branched-chain amino acid transport system substrate-binding protein